MTALVRSAVLTHFTEVAQSCRLDAHALVTESGLPARCLADPDLMLPAGRVAALLELAARRGREPAFGLRMAAARRLSNLGPLGLLVRDQPTLRHAMVTLIRHIYLHNQAMAVTLEEAGDRVMIKEDFTTGQGGSTRQAVEMAMGTTFRILSIFMGEAWRPRQVCFAHTAPPSTATHQRVFGPSVSFAQSFNGIVCNAEDLDAPNPGADPVMARYTRRLLDKNLAKNAPMSERVRRLAVLMLPRGHCFAESVAQHLGMTRRTMANHLAAERTTFSGVIEAMRQDLLSRYLAEDTHSLTEVSALLGFSELSAFSRWHRKQFGTTARDRKTEASTEQRKARAAGR